MALTEGQHHEEFLVSEANGERSRDLITLISGQNLSAGAPLGKITVGAATAAAVAGNTGNGTCGAVTVSAGAKPGVYNLVVIEPGTNAGKFTVEDPDGITIGVGTVGSAFSAGGLAFTLADGATDFVSGDAFTITVAAGSGKYTFVAPSASNGSQVAVAVLLRNTDASGGDVVCPALVADAEVNADEMSWGALSSPQIATVKTQLKLVGIVSREAI